MFGTVVGLFIPAVLQAGFVIIGVEPFWQGVAVGIVLIAAVYVDQSRRAAAFRGADINPTALPRNSAAIRQVKGSTQVNRYHRPVSPRPGCSPRWRLAAAGCLVRVPSPHRPEHQPAPQRRRQSRPRGRPASRRQRQRHQGEEALQALRSSRESPGDEFYITMQCGIEAEAAKLGRHRQHAGSPEVRPDPAEADPGLGGRLEAGRHPDRTDRRHGDAGTAGGRSSPAASRSSWSTPPSTTPRSPFRPSPPTTRAAERRLSRRSSSSTPRAARSWSCRPIPASPPSTPGSRASRTRSRPTPRSPTSACSTRTTIPPPRPS